MRKYEFCTMIGNPAFYGDGFRTYDQKTLDVLKEHKVTSVLVNIAWSRPYIDAVIPEHVVKSKEFPLLSDDKTVALRSAQLKSRVKAVHEAGMKAIALFGIPLYVQYDELPEEYKILRGSTFSTVSVDQVTCIQSEAVRRYYKELLKTVITELDLDGMLVYSYDELAEVCDEDSDCPRCAGIPLEDRLPGFLNEINAHCKGIKPGFEMWWEPWELSASQVYRCLETLDVSIAVSCHSTLHEVYHVNHPDIFVRNVGMIAARQGRKFIVEMFLSGSGEDIGPIAGYPCPRLIYEQIKSLELLEGVTGIKEYFGTAVPYLSVNEKMTALALSNDDGYEENVLKLAGRHFKDKAKKDALIKAWSLSSQSLLMAPWDMSWVLRFSNLQPYDRAYYGKVHFKDAMKTPWVTPSWQSNRRSYYLIVDNENNLTPHMWRDFDKRMESSVDYAEQARTIIESLAGGDGELKMQATALKTYELIMTARRNYMLLCNLLTKYTGGEAEKTEIIALLEADLKNAKDYLAHSAQLGIEHYFPAANTEDGIAFIEDVLRNKEAVLKGRTAAAEYFTFLNYAAN